MKSKFDQEQEEATKGEDDDPALNNFFKGVALYSATNPIRVIFIGVLLICGLSYGMRFSLLETDPVALWTPKDSKARLERDYFDAKFGSIYRIEQLIITARNVSAEIEHVSPVDGPLIYGPVLNKGFLEGLHTLQNLIKEVCIKMLIHKITIQNY
jgi:hypothetical protein